MTVEFIDINIVGMDEIASSRPGPGKSLFNIVLNLSSSAPHDWVVYFNQKWQQHFYMTKRDVTISGSKLNIYCAPDEVKTDHIPKLNKVISETNQWYRQHLSSKMVEEKRKTEKAKKDNEAMRKLKNDLDIN